MITWAIEPARKSRCFEQVIISTGDAENADISHQWGADTDEDWHRADLMLRALSKIEEW
jgi:CMP-N-acetylneuraminic acid synthetase